MEVTSRSVNDESALFDDDNEDDEQIVVNRTGPAQKETSKQRLVSMAKLKPEFEGLRTTTVGHRIQEVKELMTVPVRTFKWFCGLKDRPSD
jgi:protein SSD1